MGSHGSDSDSDGTEETHAAKGNESTAFKFPGKFHFPIYFRDEESSDQDLWSPALKRKQTRGWRTTYYHPLPNETEEDSFRSHQVLHIDDAIHQMPLLEAGFRWWLRVLSSI
ncbi:uncharacterized protein PAE49_011845 isoform 2-T2 [Odontesthes bonariensis]